MPSPGNPSGPRDQTSVFCNVDSLPTESPRKPEPEDDRKYKNLHLGTRKIQMTVPLRELK